MHRVRFHRPMLAAVAAGALLLSACGSSGSDDAADSTTTTSTSTTVPENPEAAARAGAIAVTVSDFPDGWEAVDSTEAPPNDCDPTFSDDSTHLATFEGDAFLLGDPEGDNTKVSVTTTVYITEEDAEAALAPYADAAVMTCMDDAFTEAFGADGANEIDGAYEPLDLTVDGVDQTVAARAEYTITGTGADAHQVTFTVVGMRTADLVTQVNIVTSGEPLAADELQSVFDKVAALQAA